MSERKCWECPECGREGERLSTRRGRTRYRCGRGHEWKVPLGSGQEERKARPRPRADGTRKAMPDPKFVEGNGFTTVLMKERTIRKEVEKLTLEELVARNKLGDW